MVLHGLSLSLMLDTADIPSIDWSSFLFRHDLHWTKLPSGWGDAPFIGNGDLGAVIHMQDGQLIWEINRTSLYVNRSRMPVGRVKLHTAGNIIDGAAQLNLWNAEASGKVVTERGTVEWRSFVSSEPSLIIIELDKSDSEGTAAIEWIAAEPLPPRKSYRKERLAPEDIHPPATLTRSRLRTVAVQQYLGEGNPATALVAERFAGGSGSDFYAIAFNFDKSSDEALTKNRQAVAAAERLGLQSLVSAHRAWWHAYYPASFLSVPDSRLESYYWIQIYKLGSAMRDAGPVLDLNGPWFSETPWPMIWWNLNAQLAYSPLATANRLPLSESLWRLLDERHTALRANAVTAPGDSSMALGRASSPDLRSAVDLIGQGPKSPPDNQLESGNLPWLLHYYREAAVYLADNTMLRDRVLPLLRGAISFYLVHLKRGEDGMLHLPRTHSPELATLQDANYDLMLLVWGLRSLIADHERLSIKHPELGRWRETLRDLPPFSTDETGLLIGPGRPLRESHRHYSHLLGVYPLRILQLNDPIERELVERSINHWIGLLSQGGFLTGYTHTGAAAMWALLGDGERAWGRLNTMLDRFGEPNTFYKEMGPTIDTPLSVATSLQDMLLQSHGETLHLFPAVPDAWTEASFATLRGEGAFLISAVRRVGRTAWIRIESCAGGPCALKLPNGEWDSVVVLASSSNASGIEFGRSTDGRFILEMPQQSWIELGETSFAARLTPEPVYRSPQEYHPFPRLDRAANSISY